MTCVLSDGPTDITGGKDDDGHFEFIVKHAVEADFEDGPYSVMLTPGLPVVGSPYAFLGEFHPWAFCWPNIKVNCLTPKGMRSADSSATFKRKWSTEQKFSTRAIKSCQDTEIQDPLLLPPDISGTFVKYTREAVFDRNGRLIMTSSHEQIRGPQAEFDANRPTVSIGQNVNNLELEVFSQMVDGVNSAPLWGVDSRCIKISNAYWERRILGSCGYYFTRHFDFDVDFEGFDRHVADHGSMVLNGHWSTPDEETDGKRGWILDKINNKLPNPNNPQHYIRAVDRLGNIVDDILLDGAGKPVEDPDDVGEIIIEKYNEFDFLVLGIPAALN